jgi:hypothetical protein
MKCIVADDKKPRACNLGRMRKQVSNSISARIIVRALSVTSGTVSFISPCFDLLKGDAQVPSTDFTFRTQWVIASGAQPVSTANVLAAAKQSPNHIAAFQDCFAALAMTVMGRIQKLVANDMSDRFTVNSL